MSTRLFVGRGLVAVALLGSLPRVVADPTPPFNVTASAAILNTDGSNLPGTNPSAPGGPCPTVTNVPGCLVQIIGVGTNSVADLPYTDGSVGGDDVLLLTSYIGVGMSPCAQQSGRFTDSLTAADGTKIYARVFNARTLGAATDWGQSAVFTVAGATVMDASALGLKRTAMPMGVNLATTLDSKGQPYYTDLIANLNPLDPSDVFTVTRVTPSNGQVDFLGHVGRSYTLQRSVNLMVSNGWSDLVSTALLATNQDDTLITLTDPSPPASSAFYRIKVIMP
jgi:hypothetical protein